jgi:hypothetical protein
MKTTLFALFTIILVNLGFSQTDCPEFSSPQDKPAKLRFYTEAQECFTLSSNGKVINPEPSKDVTFYVNYGTVSVKLVMSDGQVEEKKVYFTNTAIYGIHYEIVKNEKKGTYDTKMKLGQQEMTADGMQKQQQDVQARMEASKQKLAEEQKARDDAWDQQMANDKARRAEESKASSQEVEKMFAEDNNQTENQVQSTEQPTAQYSTATGDYPFIFKYAGVPLREKVVAADFRDSDKQMLGGTTDSDGVVVFKSDLPHGTYPVDFRFKPNANSEISKLAYTVNLAPHDGTPQPIDFKDYVDAMAEMMEISVGAMESMLGFDKLKD